MAAAQTMAANEIVNSCRTFDPSHANWQRNRSLAANSDGAEGIAKSRGGIRFVHEANRREILEKVVHVSLLLAARNHERQRRVHRANFPDQGIARPVPRSEVEDDRIDAAWNERQLVQGLSGGSSNIDFQACLFEIFRCKELNQSFVFYEENAGGCRFGINDIAQLLAERRLRERFRQQLHTGIEFGLHGRLRFAHIQS